MVAESRKGRARKALRLAWHQVERAIDGADRAWRRGRSAGDAEEREASHWSGRSDGGLTWQDHPLVREHINRRVSGDPAVNWIDWFAREYAPGGLGRALNLGCGAGDLEAHALSIGLAREFHSIDLSAAAVERARARLAGRPVSFEVGDVNDAELGEAAYDAVFAASSLHHFTALEEVFERVERSLKPGGWLVFDEFTGPSRFQWTEAQLSIINELLRALPRRLKRDRRRGWGVKGRVYRAPLDERDRNSPFEAIRSAEILPLVSERFEVVSRRDYGGGILHQLLDGIAGNFEADRPDDAALLQRLGELELSLERSGRIGSDFTVVVARRR